MPFATSWSWRSSDGTVNRLRANEGAGLLYGDAVSRPLCRRAVQCIAPHRAGRDRIRSQPRPPSGRQRQQAALLGTAEPSWRVSDESEAAVDVAMLIILAQGTVALAPIAQSRRALRCQRMLHQTAAASARFTRSTARDRRATHSPARPATATLLACACSFCCEPVVHSAPHRPVPTSLGCRMAGHDSAPCAVETLACGSRESPGGRTRTGGRYTQIVSFDSLVRLFLRVSFCPAFVFVSTRSSLVPAFFNSHQPVCLCMHSSSP